VCSDYVAYAAGSEDNSSEDLTDCAGTACPVTAGTDTGRDIRLQCHSDRVDNTRDIAVVCPSGEATVDSSHGSGHKHSSVFKSSSMPLMCSQPPPSVSPVDRKSLDSELRYLSTYAKLCRFPSSPLENSKNGHIARSPYMSPLLASDDVLRQLCPVHLIVCFTLSYSRNLLNK